MAYIGIDLGTTFSAMAYVDRDGQTLTIPNAEGELTTPSVVLFESAHDVLVGREAKRAALAEPERVAEDTKRYMGEEFYPRLLLNERFSPVTLSAVILMKLKRDAEARLGSIDGVVITVPAYFDERRRQATAAAAQSAGLTLLDIINEPTAAALAYAYRDCLSAVDSARPDARLPAQTLVVYDLGGGTFDVTALRTQGGELTVLATAGDVRLGGRDWDERLFHHLADLFVHEKGDDPRDDALSRQQLMQQAEELKKDLSRRTRVVFAINHAGKTLRGELTREQFESMTADLLFRSESRVSRVLRDAGLTWDKVDEVLAVGGSTRMPQVQAMLRRVAGKQPNVSLSPDEAVAHGAAIHAAIRVAAEPPSPPLPQTPPAASAAEPETGAAVASEPAPVAPATAVAAAPVANAQAVPSSQAPATPWEALAAAASAVNAGDPRSPINENQRRRYTGWLGSRLVQLLGSIRTSNVNAHSLGIVAEDGNGRRRATRLIPRNTPLPVTVSRCFATVTANQKRVTVQVVEGESQGVADCNPVGTCIIRKLPPGLPKGSPVEVTFSYDGSGRLHIQAVDVIHGAWAQTIIQRGGGVDPRKVRFNIQLLSRLRLS
jgi:molecular chaperone DnaK